MSAAFAIVAFAPAGCSQPAEQNDVVAEGSSAAIAPEDAAMENAAIGHPSAAATPTPTPTPSPMDDTAPIGPLGIARGYYVDVSVPCARATDVFFYDGARAGVTDYPGKGSVPGLDLEPVGKVTREEGGGLFIEALAMEVHKLPSGRISLTIQDDGPPMRRCATDEIPARFRVR